MPRAPLHAAALLAVLALAAVALPGAASAQPGRCGDRPGEVPCRWADGAYLVSGFTARYDVRGPGGRTASERAVAQLVDRERNGLVVLVVELFKGRDGVVEYREGMTANDQQLLDAARAARRRGAQVAIRLKVESARGGVGTSACSNAFAHSYLSHVDHYAEVASDAGVRYFVVAGELTRAFEDACDALWDGYWGDVLYSASSRLGPGPEVVVTVAADALDRMLGGRTASRYRWIRQGAASGRLDLLGVAGAPALADRPTTSVRRLVAGWRRPAARIRALRRAYGRPVVLDGIGFPRCPGAATGAGSCRRGAPGGAKAQSAAVQATLCHWTGWQRDHPRQRWFRGLWWWAHDLTAPRHRSLFHLGSRARPRSAAARITAWNRGRGERRTCG